MANDQSRPILMVDARNCMYRAIYAARHERERQRGGAPRHALTYMLRIIAGWIREFDPSSVQVYWDTPRNSVWRRKIYPGYKDRDNNHYIADISQELVSTQRAARAVFTHLNVHQLKRDRMEADDLIYAGCKLQCHQPMIICSTDSDMLQIPFMMRSVQVYNPETKRLVPVPECNPVQQKALVGDTADRITGYRGIGPAKSRKLLDHPGELHRYLEQHGRATYVRNLLLIDLSLCPELLANQLYVGKVLAQPPRFDRAALARLQGEYKLAGMMADYADVVLPFQRLVPEVAKSIGSQ